jgi:hypothetical protein
MSVSTHEIELTVDQATSAKLNGVGACAYGLVAYETSNLSALPLVVWKASPISSSQTVSWEETYKCFVVRLDIADMLSDPVKRTIKDAALSAPIAPGWAATISQDLLFNLTKDGNDEAFTLRTEQAGPLTCGITFGTGGNFQPACALPLLRGIDAIVAPVQRVFLMLSTSNFELGAWVEKSAGDGLLVDMADASKRTVKYDSAAAKSPWPDASDPASIWATSVAPGTDLANLLRGEPAANIPRR